MILKNYHAEFVPYAILNEDKINTFGLLPFCNELETTMQIVTFNSEQELESYINTALGEDYYSLNKLEYSLPTESDLNMFIENGYMNSLGFRMSMSEQTANDLNATLIASKGANLSGDTVIYVKSSYGDLFPIKYADFSSFVFEYQQSRLVFMKAVDTIKSKMKNGH